MKEVSKKLDDFLKLALDILYEQFKNDTILLKDSEFFFYSVTTRITDNLCAVSILLKEIDTKPYIFNSIGCLLRVSLVDCLQFYFITHSSNLEQNIRIIWSNHLYNYYNYLKKLQHVQAFSEEEKKSIAEDLKKIPVKYSEYFITQDDGSIKNKYENFILAKSITPEFMNKVTAVRYAYINYSFFSKIEHLGELSHSIQEVYTTDTNNAKRYINSSINIICDVACFLIESMCQKNENMSELKNSLDKLKDCIRDD